MLFYVSRQRSKVSFLHFIIRALKAKQLTQFHANQGRQTLIVMSYVSPASLTLSRIRCLKTARAVEFSTKPRDLQEIQKNSFLFNFYFCFRLSFFFSIRASLKTTCSIKVVVFFLLHSLSFQTLTDDSLMMIFRLRNTAD